MQITTVSDPGMVVEMDDEVDVEEEESPQSPDGGPKVSTAADDLYEYLVYTPTSATPRVWSGRRTIFSRPGDEAMYSCVNRFLEAINWVQLISWRNNTAATQTYSYSYTTGMTITQGSEINQGFNLGASYQGMSIGYNFSHRVFKTTETTSSRTTTVTVNVPPHSLLIFYQRRFDFRDEVTFICDAWGREWNIGHWGGYRPHTQLNTRVQVMAEEYFTSERRLLSGPGRVTTTNVARAPIADITRMRENVTRRAKDMLVRMGL
ncbi:hypothetical protein CVT24_011935 [Panaeolus cyanescens]|uniref:Uncharacterized protein n=1 Tax=Panaeolus cyanescens TaxID=181874 RepID=A0A409VXP7_9AGAR|nr:hypothetical protein CVT24_011935 [Panaeolus cyanescens]